MRFAGSGIARLSWLVGTWVIALAIWAVFVEAAPASSGGPDAVASKKKCKKALGRCAPKRYYLIAHGQAILRRGSEHFYAEVRLQRRQAGYGGAIYTTSFGEVGVGASFILESSDHLLDCLGDVSFVVPDQVIAVGPTEIFGQSFQVAFFRDRGKPTYYLLPGPPPDSADPSIESFARISQTCLADPTNSQISVDFLFAGPTQLDTTSPGRPGDRLLTGKVVSGGNSVEWELTTRPLCGQICSTGQF